MSATYLRSGVVVEPAADLGGLQAHDGAMLAPETLGPGIVESLAPDGRVCVRWVGAGLNICLDPVDIRPLGPNAHLLTIKRRDKDGSVKMLRHKVVATSGFNHNWTVELLPGHVVRVVRSDSSAWTFKYNWLFQRIDAWWPQPPDDDDAEALAVADIALMK